MSELAIPPDAVVNDIDVTGAGVLNVPVTTTPKSESGTPTSREEVGELLHDNPKSTVVETKKATESLSPGTKDGFNSETREAIRTAERVVVKIGSSSLIGSNGRTDSGRTDSTADALEKCMGISDVIVIPSGAVASGMGSLGLASRPSDLVTKQAAAAVGQVHLAREWGRSLPRYGRTSAQMLLTSDDAGTRSHAHNVQRTIDRLRQLDVMLIVNENDAVVTPGFCLGDNDRLVALTSHLAYYDALTPLSGVDGLCGRNPADPGAAFVPEMRSGSDLCGVAAGDGGALGIGGTASKMSAVRLALHTGMSVLLILAPSIERALDQVDVRTAFSAKGNHLSAWKFWMFCVADSSGLLRLGAGAVDTVTRMCKSLSPVGITAVSGEFSAGDIVDLIGPSSEAVGCGEVNYDSKELLGTIGYHTEEPPNGMQKPVVCADYLSDFASRAQEGIVLKAAALKDAYTWVRPDRNASAKSN